MTAIYCGRHFTDRELDRIRELGRILPSRQAIARAVCTEFGWRKPDGGLKATRSPQAAGGWVCLSVCWWRRARSGGRRRERRVRGTRAAGRGGAGRHPWAGWTVPEGGEKATGVADGQGRSPRAWGQRSARGDYSWKSRQVATMS